MEHPALTREQVEAMDETMTFATHRVTQLHRRNELGEHFPAPGVIEHHTRPGLLSRLWNRLTGAQQGALILAGSAAAVVSAFVWAVS